MILLKTKAIPKAPLGQNEPFVFRVESILLPSPLPPPVQH